MCVLFRLLSAPPLATAHGPRPSLLVASVGTHCVRCKHISNQSGQAHPQSGTGAERWDRDAHGVEGPALHRHSRWACRQAGQRRCGGRVGAGAPAHSLRHWTSSAIADCGLRATEGQRPCGVFSASLVQTPGSQGQPLCSTMTLHSAEDTWVAVDKADGSFAAGEGQAFHSDTDQTGERAPAGCASHSVAAMSCFPGGDTVQGGSVALWLRKGANAAALVGCLPPPRAPLSTALPLRPQTPPPARRRCPKRRPGAEPRGHQQPVALPEGPAPCWASLPKLGSSPQGSVCPVRAGALPPGTGEAWTPVRQLPVPRAALGVCAVAPAWRPGDVPTGLFSLGL